MQQIRDDNELRRLRYENEQWRQQLYQKRNKDILKELPNHVRKLLISQSIKMS